MNIEGNKTRNKKNKNPFIQEADVKGSRCQISYASLEDDAIGRNEFSFSFATCVTEFRLRRLTM